MTYFMSRYFFISFLLLYSLTSAGQGLGVDISAPVSMLHVYENTANTGIVAGISVEQDGTGDAESQFLLTGGQRWVTGIDNSDGDKFKIASDVDLNTSSRITITPTGDVGIGVNTPKEVLQIGESATAASKLQIEGNFGAGYSGSIIFQDQTQVSPVGEVEIGYFDVDDSFRLELDNVRVVSQVQGTDDFDIAGTVVGGFGMIDVSFTRDQVADNDFAAIIVATNPSDNSVRLRVNSNKNENIQALDNAAVWEAWANFGIPDGGAGAQIMDVSVGISHTGSTNNDLYAAMITARMDDGTVYIRTTVDDQITIANLDNTADWGGWVSLGNDGFL